MLVKKKKFPKSIRKYVRRKKSEIRKEFLDIETCSLHLQNLDSSLRSKLKKQTQKIKDLSKKTNN